MNNYKYFVSQDRRLKLVFPVLISATSGVIKQLNNYNVHRAWQIKLFEMMPTAVLGYQILSGNSRYISLLCVFTIARNFPIIIMVYNIGRSLQERGKQHGIISRNIVNIKFQNKSCADLSYPRFVGEFNIYNISGDDPMSPTCLLATAFFGSFLPNKYTHSS